MQAARNGDRVTISGSSGEPIVSLSLEAAISLANDLLRCADSEVRADGGFLTDQETMALHQRVLDEEQVAYEAERESDALQMIADTLEAIRAEGEQITVTHGERITLTHRADHSGIKAACGAEATLLTQSRTLTTCGDCMRLEQTEEQAQHNRGDADAAYESQWRV